MSSNSTYYLVADKTTVFTLIFADDENDRISINASQNNYIGFYIQSTNNSNIYNLILEASKVMNDSTSLFIQYTDSFHQDSSFIKILTLELLKIKYISNL